MEVILHKRKGGTKLKKSYVRAFSRAVELYVLTAYLTEWDSKLHLNKACRKIRIIIGQDFGITRKEACTKALRWLPSGMKHQLLVVDKLPGFHPKAVFWKEADGTHHAIVGSSNLTNAAFNKNIEANVCSSISSQIFLNVKRWVAEIERSCTTVTPGWIADYKQAKIGKPKPMKEAPTHQLPSPIEIKKVVRDRRRALTNYQAHRAGLISLFKKCATGVITSKRFYDQLPQHWSYKKNDRLQGLGWARLGKSSNFSLFSKSYLRMLEATDEDRDETVATEIEFLRAHKSPLRASFLSEMLCLEFPHQYPVLNSPVKKWLKDIGYKPTWGANEGSKYIALARFMRSEIKRAKRYPAKSIAELDAVISTVYGRHSTK